MIRSGYADSFEHPSPLTMTQVGQGVNPIIISEKKSKGPPSPDSLVLRMVVPGEMLFINSPISVVILFCRNL